MSPYETFKSELRARGFEINILSQVERDCSSCYDELMLSYEGRQPRTVIAVVYPEDGSYVLYTATPWNEVGQDVTFLANAGSVAA